MMRRPDSYLLFIFSGFIISQSVPGIAVGPANVRLQDLFALFMFFIFYNRYEKIVIPKQFQYIVLPLIGLFSYSLLLTSVQSYPIANSFIEFIDLLILIVILLIMPTFLIDSSEYIVQRCLEILFYITIIGSAISIPYYFVTGNRFVGVWYIFGLPVIGLFIGCSMYVKKRNWLSIMGISIITISIILARSRSRWILIPSSIILLVLLTQNRKRFILAIKNNTRLVVSIFLLGIPIVSTQSEIFARFRTLIEGGGLIFARPVRYYSGYQVWLDHPFGVGLGNYTLAVQDAAERQSLIFPDWFVEVAGTSVIERQLHVFTLGRAGPHSDVFQFLLETGPIGLVLFTLFWLFILREIIVGPMYEYRIAVMASIIYIGLQSIINTQLLSGFGVILIVLISFHIHEKLKKGTV